MNSLDTFKIATSLGTCSLVKIKMYRKFFNVSNLSVFFIITRPYSYSETSKFCQPVSKIKLQLYPSICFFLVYISYNIEYMKEYIESYLGSYAVYDQFQGSYSFSVLIV